MRGRLFDENLPVLCIVGPTCSGKSELTVKLARELEREGVEIEIIVADSRKVYKFFDIGTAKPPDYVEGKLRARLVSVADPRTQRFSAKEFEVSARKIIRQAFASGRVPVVEGGTWLYVRALEFGLMEHPEASQLKKELEKLDNDQLRRMLKEIDPEAYRRIHPNDRYRTIRAIIIKRTTGRSVTEGKFGERFEHPLVKIGIFWGWRELRRRLEARTQKLVERGLLNEVKNLVDMLGKEHPLMKTISYKEALLYLEGKADLERMKKLIVRDNLRYARYQTKVFSREGTSWFSNLPKAFEYSKNFVLTVHRRLTEESRNF